MTRREGLMAVAIIALAIPVADRLIRNAQSGAVAQESTVQPKAVVGDEQGILDAGAAYMKAMQAGDLAKVLSYWSEDADYIDETGAVTRGRTALTAQFKAGMAVSKGSTYKLQSHSIKFPRPEVALQDGSVDVTAANGTKTSTRFSVIWVKSGENWLISSVRDMPTDVDAPSLAYPVLQSLEWMIGEWESEEDKAKNVQMNCRWAPNKAFLLIDYTLTREGQDPVKVEQRIGWDGFNSIVRSWVFDSAGGFGEGYWERTANVWVVATSGITPDGSSGGATNVWEFVDDNHFTWNATQRDIDGQPLPDVKVKLVRKAAKK